MPIGTTVGRSLYGSRNTKVAVAYTAKGQRRIKVCDTLKQAKAFYTKKDRAGANPELLFNHDHDQ